MKLYEIDYILEQTLERVMQNAEENDGEISEEDAEILSSLEMERNDLIEQLCLHIKNEDAMVGMIAEEEKKLLLRRKAIENRVEKTKNFLRGYLNGMKFQSPRVSVSYRSSQSVDVFIQADTLPVEYQRIKTVVEPNKTLLAVVLKSGEEVYGAKLVTKTTMAVK